MKIKTNEEISKMSKFERHMYQCSIATESGDREVARISFINACREATNAVAKRNGFSSWDEYQKSIAIRRNHENIKSRIRMG